MGGELSSTYREACIGSVCVQGIKRPGRETRRPPPFGSKIYNKWSYTFIAQSDAMA